MVPEPTTGGYVGWALGLRLYSENDAASMTPSKEVRECAKRRGKSATRTIHSCATCSLGTDALGRGMQPGTRNALVSPASRAWVQPSQGSSQTRKSGQSNLVKPGQG